MKRAQSMLFFCIGTGEGICVGKGKGQSLPRVTSLQTAEKTLLRSLGDGIKQALGPIQKKSAPLKSATGVLIQDRAQQMERWYSTTLSYIPERM